MLDGNHGIGTTCCPIWCWGVTNRVGSNMEDEELEPLLPPCCPLECISTPLAILSHGWEKEERRRNNKRRKGRREEQKEERKEEEENALPSPIHSGFTLVTRGWPYYMAGSQGVTGACTYMFIVSQPDKERWCLVGRVNCFHFTVHNFDC